MGRQELLRRLDDRDTSQAEKKLIQSEFADRNNSDPRNDCQWRERIVNLADKLGERYHYRLASLDTFEVYHEAQRPVLARLRALVPDLRQFITAGRSLIFYGTVGTGKDHLMAAMLYEAVNADCSASWVGGRDTFGGGAVDFLGRRRSVLGISDPVLPVGRPADWEMPKLHEVIDDRYRARKATWLTINAPEPDAIKQMLTVPIWDRLRERAELFRCVWPSYRERAK
jgi:DNA replication protein DnaC